jgi:hypothetical protein
MFARFLLCWALLLLLQIAAPGLSIQFDYTYDSNGFFAAQTRRDVLARAAGTFTLRITDHLDPITPTGSNTWNPEFYDPSGQSYLTGASRSIAADTVLIFVGAQDLGGALGKGGPGGYTRSGSASWRNTVDARGQTGALATTPTDFGPWGGSISFDLNSSWYFDPEPSTMESFAGKDDFYSVAVHELAHVLGIGTAGSWDAQLSGSYFEGSRAKAANGGAHVALSGDLSHWANGTTSKVFGTSTLQETVMDPDITVGTRKYFTNLDYAGLQDVGWLVAVPEPSGLALVVVGMGLLIARVRRRKACSPSSSSKSAVLGRDYD